MVRTGDGPVGMKAITVSNTDNGEVFSVDYSGLTTHAGGVSVTGGDLEIYNGTAIIGEPGALPQIKLWLKQGVTGSTTAYGIANDTLIENDVTSDFRSYWSNPRYSIAGSFNVANVVHFGANESAFPAGVTVGREIGFHATSTIRNATENYGFFSELSKRE